MQRNRFLELSKEPTELFEVIAQRDKIEKNEMGWACGAYG